MEREALTKLTTQRSVKNSRDFRFYLEAELVRRCKANPQYSLRAFARLLGLDSSRLSKILRGERPVRAELIPKLGQRLGLARSEILKFRAMAESKKSKVAPSFQHIALDAFESIEDWRHYAILELMKVKDFEPDLKWVAKALSVTIFEARAYVERLKRIGLLEISADGSWLDLSQGFSSHILGENETTFAHRRAQKELLRLAGECLETIPIERRDQSSMMMATSSSKMAEAKRRITAFRHELCQFLEDCDERDTVYQLSVSLFPLIKS